MNKNMIAALTGIMMMGAAAPSYAAAARTTTGNYLSEAGRYLEGYRGCKEGADRCHEHSQ